MKKILLIISAILILIGCSKGTGPDNFRDELFIDSTNTAAEGSYVQGAPLNAFSKVTIPYQNAKGGTARIWADERNGMAIIEQTITMEKGEGTAVVEVSGMPIELTNTFLQINIAYAGQTYISSVEIPVTMDPDPNGIIVFTISGNPIISLLEPVEIPFTVNPPMAAVIVDVSGAANLTTRVDQNLQSGSGIITLTPAAQFLSGSITVSATFGVRPVQSTVIDVNAFDGGDGTPLAPYQVSTVDQFMKVGYGTSSSYQIKNNLNLGEISPISAAFAGSVDVGGFTLEYTINKPTTDNVALFSTIGATASISNMVLKGSVVGQDNVAALAATNNGATLTSIDASAITVLGRNNIALLSASGAGKDAKVLLFTNTPASVNITQGLPDATVAMGIAPQDASVIFDAGTTNLQSVMYNSVNGQATFTMPVNAGDFNPGNVTFTVYLDANVTAVVRTINVTSKKMYESGTGVAGDPYMVMDKDQLYATMTTYPDQEIEVMNDIDITGWMTVPNFSGLIDGAGFKLTNLTTPFIDTNSGTIENIKFTGVNIVSASTASTGAVANITTGTIRSVAVAGNLTTTATGDRQFGGIAGTINAGVISNCYVNATITASATGVGGIAGFFNGTTAAGARVEFCTTEGSITWSNSTTRVGGIVGRKNSNAGGADYITNCLSKMILSGTSGDTGSNMIGGIFGVSSSGMTDNRLFIKECVFAGRVRTIACAGGIAGLGPDIADCMVIGEGPLSANSTIITSTYNNGATGGITAGAKGNITRSIVADATLTGPTTSGGIVSGQNNGTPTASACVVLNTSLSVGAKSIYGSANTSVALSSCFFSSVIYSDGTEYELTSPTNDGTPAAGGSMTQAWYESLGYNFATIWQWDAAKSRPSLRNVGCSIDVIP